MSRIIIAQKYIVPFLESTQPPPGRSEINSFADNRRTRKFIKHLERNVHTSLYGLGDLRFYDPQSHLPLRGRFTQLIERKKKTGRPGRWYGGWGLFVGQAPFAKSKADSERRRRKPGEQKRIDRSRDRETLGAWERVAGRKAGTAGARE